MALYIQSILHAFQAAQPVSEAAAQLRGYVDEQLRDLQAQIPAFLAAVGGEGAAEGDGQGGDDLAAGEPLTPPQVLVLLTAGRYPWSEPEASHGTTS